MKILEKLEWDKIITDVTANALTSLGKSLVETMPIYDDIKIIEQELLLVDEAKKLTDALLLPPLNSLHNIGEILKEAKFSGGKSRASVSFFASSTKRSSCSIIFISS